MRLFKQTPSIIRKGKMEHHGSTYRPEVSVIVLTYNQDLNRIVKTLDSIVVQEGISFEVIVCDDGSTTRFEKELTDYFLSKGFDHYELIFHGKNEGTVANFYSGLQKAKGKYSKVISPGDYLASKSTLCEWVRYLERDGADWSFSDALYYRVEDGTDSFFRTNARPQLVRPYTKRRKDECIWNYVVLCDVANGAATIGKTSLQLAYCKVMKDNNVVYTEDFMWRLMMFRGIVGCYYPESTICYEYGTGVSTSGNLDWKEKLRKDGFVLAEMLSAEQDASHKQRRIAKAFIINTGTNKLKKLLIKGKLFLWVKLHFFPRLTKLPEECDLS